MLILLLEILKIILLNTILIAHTSTLLTLKHDRVSDRKHIMQCLEIKFSNNLLEFPWVPIVPYCKQTYFCILMEQNLLKKNKSVAVGFNSTFRYTDDILSINNCQFNTYFNSIHPRELEIKDGLIVYASLKTK